jgi:hypothetical protein
MRSASTIWRGSGPPKVWRELVSNLVTHAIPQCGNLRQKEQPEAVTRLLVDFLESWKG